MQANDPNRTKRTLVPMISIVQYSRAHSFTILCAAFLAVTQFWCFFSFRAFYGRLSLAYKFTSSADPIQPFCLCSACRDNGAPCPSGLDSERCHVGRCGEGEELWHGHLKFKCFERYEWQLFKEYFTQFQSCVNENW